MELSEAKELALRLMSEFELKDWKFKFDRAKQRFGMCDYTDKLIQLSEPLTLINEDFYVEDTIRHEIAHALVGAKANHGYNWRIKAIECGAEPVICYSNEEVNEIVGKFVYSCPNCGLMSFRHRKIRKNIACKKCCDKYNNGNFNNKYLFEFQRMREDINETNN